MKQQYITPTVEQIRDCYVTYLQRTRNREPEKFAQESEKFLSAFIRQFVDVNFNGILNRLDHNFYERVRSNIATNPSMREADDAMDLFYSVHLRVYSSFLESNEFHKLFKLTKVNTAANPTKQEKEIKSTTFKERELTEGEKKHVEYETAHRNPTLRQACIDKYGYQCQCCGMDFKSLYGEELGGNFIEVHHLKMISTYDESKPNDYVENLVPLCSNCHSMIHHGKEGPLTLGELRKAYKGEKKELKICKED